jgi:hypothetical protein
MNTCIHVWVHNISIFYFFIDNLDPNLLPSIQILNLHVLIQTKVIKYKIYVFCLYICIHAFIYIYYIPNMSKYIFKHKKRCHAYTRSHDIQICKPSIIFVTSYTQVLEKRRTMILLKHHT